MKYKVNCDINGTHYTVGYVTP